MYLAAVLKRILVLVLLLAVVVVAGALLLPDGWAWVIAPVVVVAVLIWDRRTRVGHARTP